MRIKYKLICIALLLSVASVCAQNTLTYLSSTTGAACQAIKYYDNHVFTGTGSTLRAYYVGPGHTTPYTCVFEHRYVSQIIRMRLRGHYLFVAANYDGLTKWDISNPAHPVRVFDILPDTSTQSTQAVAFSGDTIFAAQFHEICAYKDQGNSFYKIADVCQAPLFGTINGLDVKNNLLAYSVTQIGGQNGVYIRDISTGALLSFYQVGGFLMENVIWGKNNNLLHVMAGTNTTEGYFFTLDASAPAAPVKVFGDTVNGVSLGLAMALPYNAENHNDTIYVANWGGLKPGDITQCYIRAYDVTDGQNVHLINYLPAGLWHFDMTVHYPKMYVASEWYGIKTVNISDIMNPTDEGNTLTGGWNVGSDAWGDLLAVANEGYGLKIYDISNPALPVLKAVKNDPGFCFNAVFSADGSYVYTTNMTYQGMRVYRTDSLIQTGYIQQAVCDGVFLVQGQRIFSELDNKLNIISVSNPYAPVITGTYPMSINGMAVADGLLFVSGNDSLSVYDISANNFNFLTCVVFAPGQDGKKIAVYGNSVFLYVGNKGLVRYELQNNGGTNTLSEQQVYTLPNGEPAYLAADTFALYAAYRLQGLYAYDKLTMAQTGFYRTGLDYRKYTTMYGVQGLFCKNNLLFLVEYFAQTSVLSGNPDYTSGVLKHPGRAAFSLYPNPASRGVLINCQNNPAAPLQLMVYNAGGQLVMTRTLNGNPTEYIPLGTFQPGIFVFALYCGNTLWGMEKVLLHR